MGKRELTMPSKPPTILVVEDDPDNRELLAEALTKAGYDVLVAHSGEEALRKAEAQTFRLILSDIQMGAVSGMELLKWFRKEFSDTPVILLTAYGSVETAVEAMKNGAFDYVT